jgi:thiol-disulfide isomerase/thioredoxin
VIKLLLMFMVALVVSVSMPAFAVPQKGSPAPPLRIVTTAGQKVTLENYKGRVLVVEFFATWCGGCNDSMPYLLKLNKQYGKQGLHILGLNPGVRGDTLDVVRRYVRKNQINFPVALVDDDVLLSYGVQPIPAIFIIDRNGVVVQKYVGFTSETLLAMETTIQNLLKQ